MKKIFTCTLFCFFGFYLTGKTQLRLEFHSSHTHNGEPTLGVQQVGILNFKANKGVKNNFTSHAVLEAKTTTNLTAASDNVFKRWLTDGSIQTQGEMTIAFSSFTVNSVDNISILFLVPLKKFIL